MSESKNKWLRGIVVTVIAAAIGGAVGREGMRYFFRGETDVRSQRVLSKIASELNKTLPMQVDKDTELMATAGFDAVIVYSYRLINSSVNDVDQAAFSEAVRPQLVNAACTTPQTRDGFLRKGVTMRYMYADKDRRHIATIDVNPADCSS
jgi:hypothetical protein